MSQYPYNGPYTSQNQPIGIHSNQGYGTGTTGLGTGTGLGTNPNSGFNQPGLNTGTHNNVPYQQNDPNQQHFPF